MAAIPFFSAPHRMMFAGGVVQALAAMALWTWELLGRLPTPLQAPAWPWPPAWIHGGLMVFSIFPWFVFGFLMTALPKWMAARPLPQRRFVPPFTLMAAGWVLFYLGLLWPLLAPIGLAVAVAGWVGGGLALWRAVVGSLNDRRHADAVLVTLALGAAGLAVYAVALAQADAFLFRLAIETGLWGCLAPTFFTVLHRMLPFFTGAMVRGYRDYQPGWALWTVLAAFFGHGLCAILGVTAWRWLPDLVATAVVLHLSSRWGLRASFPFPMLATLHLGLLWLVVALVLYSVQALAVLSGDSWGGLLPLHALGAGFFASILIGMATRVTLGHSGRPIAGDRWGWRLFLVLQGVVVLRLAGEFASLFNLAAAFGWLVVFGGWAAVHLPMYLKARPDGQPG